MKYMRRCITQLIERAVKTEVVLVQLEETTMNETASDGMLYVVQVGAYKSLNNARNLQKKLEQMGVVSLIKQYESEVP